MTVAPGRYGIWAGGAQRSPELAATIVWKHGISLYGCRDHGFLARHPHARASKGTIRLRPEEAEDVTDQELRDLASVSLSD